MALRGNRQNIIIMTVPANNFTSWGTMYYDTCWYSDDTDRTPYILDRHLTHWYRDNMAASFQTTFTYAFSWMKTYYFFIKISLKFAPKGPTNNIPALVQIMAWRRPGDKPLSEPMSASLPTHICVTRPQWIKWLTSSPSSWWWSADDVKRMYSHWRLGMKQAPSVCVQRLEVLETEVSQVVQLPYWLSSSLFQYYSYILCLHFSLVQA